MGHQVIPLQLQIKWNEVHCQTTETNCLYFSVLGPKKLPVPYHLGEGWGKELLLD